MPWLSRAGANPKDAWCVHCPMTRFILFQLLWLGVTAAVCAGAVIWMRRSLRRAERRFSYGILDLFIASLVLLPAWVNAAIALDYWQSDATTGFFSMAKALNFFVSIQMGSALGRTKSVIQIEPIAPSTWRSAVWVGAGGVAGFLLQAVLFLIFGFLLLV